MKFPEHDEIPEEFRDYKNKYNDLVSNWFFEGLDPDSINAKEGIDKMEAVKYLHKELRNRDYEHDHKIAGVAYLMSKLLDIVEKDDETAK